MIKILKVTGNSLSPFYLPGDFVLILKRRFFGRVLSKGAIIAFTHPNYGLLIKELISFDKENNQILVQGIHPSSIDSNHFGPIPYTDVIGKVVWHYKKPRHRLNS